MAKAAGDFAKRRAKVGKKVRPASSTRIEVKARKIILPGSNGTGGTRGDGGEHEKFQKMLTKLRNNSDPTKIEGLKEMDEFVRKGKEVERFMSLAVADVFELLLNIEPKIRRAAADVLETLVRSRAGKCLLSTIPLVVPFLCSGMSSVSKGVRRDALNILAAIAKKYGHALAPHLERLLGCVLAIIQDSALLVSLQLSNAPATAPTLSSSETKQFKVSKKGVKKAREDAAKAQLERDKTSTFHCALNALNALLRSQPVHNNRAAVSSSSSFTESCQVLESTIHMGSSSMQTTAPASIAPLQKRLLHLFQDISSVEESVQPQYLLVALRKLLTALQQCATLWPAVATCPELRCFPFVCAELTRHPADSVARVMCLADADLLNLDLCDLFLQCGQGDAAPVRDYLLLTLQSSVSALRQSGVSQMPAEREAPQDKSDDDGSKRLRDLQITMIARVFSTTSQRLQAEQAQAASLVDPAAFLGEMDELFAFLGATAAPSGVAVDEVGAEEETEAPRRLLLDAATKSLCALTSSLSTTAALAAPGVGQAVARVWSQLPKLLIADGGASSYVLAMCASSLRTFLLSCAPAWETYADATADLAESLLLFFDAAVFPALDKEVQCVFVELLALLPADVLRQRLAHINACILAVGDASVASHLHSVLVYRAEDVGEEQTLVLMRDSLLLVAAGEQGVLSYPASLPGLQVASRVAQWMASSKDRAHWPLLRLRERVVQPLLVQCQQEPCELAVQVCLVVCTMLVANYPSEALEDSVVVAGMLDMVVRAVVAVAPLRSVSLDDCDATVGKHVAVGVAALVALYQASPAQWPGHLAKVFAGVEGLVRSGGEDAVFLLRTVALLLRAAKCEGVEVQREAQQWATALQASLQGGDVATACRDLSSALLD